MQPISKVTTLSCPEPGKQHIQSTTSVSVPSSFVECIPLSDAPAIRSTEVNGPPLSFSNLRGLISSRELLSARGISTGDVVAILLPNGPQLAFTLLAVASHCVAAPLDTKMSSEEISAAFHQLRPRHVIVPSQLHWSASSSNRAPDMDADKVATLQKVALEVDCKLHFVWNSQEGAAGTLQYEKLSDAMGRVHPEEQQIAQGMNENCLLLRTSGTTSKPKVVPLTGCGLFTGAVAMGKGLDLQPEDVCLNVMPFTHIGGISCSLLASIFAGSSVICAASFDPAIFIQWLADLSPTWYYAAPTIHKAIALLAASSQPLVHNLRLIRSGAANLPHKDAEELRRLFGCTVLPTYSMSECMPIAQPPLDYRLQKTGSVGMPIGASMCIVNEAGVRLPFGQVGEVCLHGPVVTKGYIDNDSANDKAFFFFLPAEDGVPWFRTGDLGYLDTDGFLFLTGRSKELIKRGGDQVSPYEVEEVLGGHPSVEVALVFGVANDFWGEEVAAVVITKSGQTTLADDGTASVQLQQHVAQHLPEQKVPKQIVVLASGDALPKTSTGKYIRSSLAQHLGLSAVDTAAARGLAAAGAAAAGSAANASSEPPQEKHFKPHKAIYGVRYIFAVWVVFVHVGPMSPAWVGVWRSYSPSMPGYFMLAGFLLASSYTGPIGSRLQFYRNRIVAAHPLYLLSILYSLPYMFLVCPPSGDGVLGYRPALGFVCGALNIDYPPPYSLIHHPVPGSYLHQILYSVIMLFFGQLAWPWGTVVTALGAVSNLILWFSSAYYFSLLCFPIFHHWLTLPSLSGGHARRYLFRPYVINFMVWPLLVTIGLTVCLASYANTAVPNAIDAVANVFKEYDPQDTSPQGVLRSLLHPGTGGFQGLSVVGLSAYTFPPIWAGVFFSGMILYRLLDMNRRAGCYVFPYWGAITDMCTLLLVLTMPMASILTAADHGKYIKIAVDLGTWWGGDQQHKLVMLLLSVWLYGLAIGQGYSAKFLGSPFLVKYLSPAAYSVYLFHYPTNCYWQLIRGNTLAGSYTATGFMHWVDYFVVLVVATCVAMFAAHKLNAPLTSLFMRLIDTLCCCGKATNEEQSTLEKVQDAVKGLTGADVTPETPILECGLDSFGTSALLGIIKPKFPGLRLTPLEIYSLQNIQALVDRIDADLQARVSSTSSSRQPLVSNCDV